MKIMIVCALLTLLAACGSESIITPTTFVDTDAVSVDPSRSDLVDAAASDAFVEATSDVMSDALPTVTDAGVDSSIQGCAPTIGHCLTNMATLCYETSFDDSVACDASGQSSGWHLGPYETGARASGGCVVGCDVTYVYRLGGYDATDETRAYAKQFCDNQQGSFIDTTPSDASTY